MPFTFILPPELSAKEPPERRGIRRDHVRLLVIDRATGEIEHSRFDKIDNYLRENDLLVFNSSRTLPASLRGCDCSAAHGPCMEVRLAEHLSDDSWLALLLCEQGDPFGCGLRPATGTRVAPGKNGPVPGSQLKESVMKVQLRLLDGDKPLFLLAKKFEVALLTGSI